MSERLSHVALLPLLALALSSAACLHVPAGTAESGLYVDLRRGVGERESDGWGLDRPAVEEVASTTIDSACAAGPEVRERVAAWLDGELERAGGVPSTGSRLLPRKTLRVARVRAVLRWWEENSEECASFGPPDPEFRGVESDHGRFVVIAQLVLGLAGFLRDAHFTMGPGLGYQLIPAYGFTPRVTVGVGIEAGALTEFRADAAAGDRVLAGQFLIGVPLLVRFLDGATVVDLEAAVSTRLDGIEPLWPPGFRLAAGYGSAGMRVNSLMTSIVFWAGYEYQPPRDGSSSEHIFRAGTRFGFDLAL
jgi:hypothetical protein